MLALVRKLLLASLVALPQVGFGAFCCCPLDLEWWGSAEYLLMWREKRHYPPLATTSDAADQGILGQPTTEILFGDERVGESPQSGGRIDLGLWFYGCWGFGGGVFGVLDEKVHFTVEGDGAGSPLLARPFFDTDAGGAPSSELVSFPTQLANGQIDVQTRNQIWGADAYLRSRWLSRCGFYIDSLLGFLYTRIEDDVEITNFSEDIAVGGFIQVSDRFNMKNDFYSGMIGINAGLQCHCIDFVFIGKLGLGSVVQTADIRGDFVRTAPPASLEEFGLLTQPSNIGSHKDHKFAAVPELSAQVRVKLSRGIFASCGYTYIYWPNVILAGNQIDLNVSFTQASQDPSYEANNTSFWAQGLSAGVYFCF